MKVYTKYEATFALNVAIYIRDEKIFLRQLHLRFILTLYKSSTDLFEQKV